MAGFSAVVAELLLNASFAFFWSKLGDSDGIDDHGIGVVGFGVREVGKGVVGLVGGFRVSFGNVICSFPLGLEGDGLLIPLVDGGGNGVHRHDSAHQGRRDSCGEISDQDVGKGYVVFEDGNIFRQGGGVGVVLDVLHHALGG